MMKKISLLYALLISVMMGFMEIANAEPSVVYTYSDPLSGETMQIKTDKKATTFKEVPISYQQLVKIIGQPTNRRDFNYVDKLGNNYQCSGLESSIILDGEFVEKRGWVVKAKSTDGTLFSHTFPGHGSLIKMKSDGMAWCKRSD
jgi:hypothetical protein